MQKFFSDLLGLPVLASEHGQQVDALIIYVHWLMIVLFVGWLAYFGYVLLRFRRSRNPRADYFGVRSHASNYIEGAVALVEGILLVAVAVPFWAKAVDKFPKDSDATVIQVVGQQFNWNARYPGKDGIFGKQEMRWVTDQNLFGVDPNDPNGKDDIQVNGLGEMHVPINKPVICYISSKDVIHSFKIIAMRVTQDAIPGMRIPIWFQPTQTGRFQINCARLCGNSHFAMSGGSLVVDTPEDYQKWLSTKTPGAAQSFE